MARWAELKHEISMQDDFLLYAVHRNYMRPKFWGTHRSDPLSSKRSPAMELGILDKIHFPLQSMDPLQKTTTSDALSKLTGSAFFSCL